MRGDAVGILDARLVTIVQSHEVEREVTLFGLEEQRCVGRGEGGEDRRTVIVVYSQTGEDDVRLELTALHIVLGEAEHVMLGRQVESMILGIQHGGGTVTWQVLDVSLTGLEVCGIGLQRVLCHDQDVAAVVLQGGEYDVGYSAVTGIEVREVQSVAHREVGRQDIQAATEGADQDAAVLQLGEVSDVVAGQTAWVGITLILSEDDAVGTEVCNQESVVMTYQESVFRGLAQDTDVSLCCRQVVAMDETEVTQVAGVGEAVQTMTIGTNPDATLVVLDDRHDVAANQGNRVGFVALVVIDGVTYSLLVLWGKDIETLVVGANPDAT